MREFRIQTGGQLASHLRSLRNSADMTQAELGARVGVAQARIAKIENNPSRVSVEQLARVLNALGADLVIQLKDKKPRSPAKARVSW